MRIELAQKYIRGRGIEIGGLHYPLEVPPGAKVTYVDRLPPEEAHPDVKHLVKIKDLVLDDAEKLDRFEINSLDFIIANHVIEHCHDPIGTLWMWAQTLVPGGIIFAAVPEKTQTFDAPRAVTKLQHVIEDAKQGVGRTDDVDHYREWLSMIDKVQEPELTKRVEQCCRERANIHFHVWDNAAMREMLAYVVEPNLVELVEFVPNGAETIWILRRTK